MPDIDSLLVLAKNTARKAFNALSAVVVESTNAQFSEALPKELKSTVDYEIEKIIIACLSVTGLPILSEETGLFAGDKESGLHWIIDPLDGTVNFTRGIGSCSVSIALWKAELPIFGVLCEYPSGHLAWGGPKIGSFIENVPIHVSTVQEKNTAILCTGFPSRFNFNDQSKSAFWATLGDYAKVRMLGAASISLLQVARGAADTYFEDQIMFWDVAAGLAIIQGAGGDFLIDQISATKPCRVIAANPMLCKMPFKAGI
jgi:myo-inositol-1(or 4)-monophosphatase